MPDESHDFGGEEILTNGKEITLIICGDCFLQKLVCKKCGLIINKVFNNKHAEYVDEKDNFVNPHRIKCNE